MAWYTNTVCLLNVCIGTNKPQPAQISIFQYHNLVKTQPHYDSEASKIGTARTNSAEGETDPTNPVIWRIDVRRIEAQVVSSASWRRTRPAVAVVADVVRFTLINIDIAATDKS